MTAFSELERLLDKPYVLERLALEHREIFEAAYELYERPYRRRRDEDAEDLQRLWHYLQKLSNLEAQSRGYLELHEAIGEQADYDLATDYLKRSVRDHGLAYLYGYAVLKMNRLPDGAIISRKVEDFARLALERIEKSAVNTSDFAQLAGAMKTAEVRGWLGRSGLRPIVVIGTNWCPDTAVSVVEVANIFDIRLHILFVEYLKLDRDAGKRANGFFLTNDHALASFEDGFKAYKTQLTQERARIPLVFYPDGSRAEEPKLTQFAARLVEFGYI